MGRNLSRSGIEENGGAYQTTIQRFFFLFLFFSFPFPFLFLIFLFLENTLRNLIRGIGGKITPESIVQTLLEFSKDVTTDKVIHLFIYLFLFFPFFPPLCPFNPFIIFIIFFSFFFFFFFTLAPSTRRNLHAKLGGRKR